VPPIARYFRRSGSYGGALWKLVVGLLWLRRGRYYEVAQTTDLAPPAYLAGLSLWAAPLGKGALGAPANGEEPRRDRQIKATWQSRD